MKVSEAIRLGAMNKPQKYGGPRYLLAEEEATCAMSAAAEAFGDEHLSATPWEERDFPILPKKCPVCMLSFSHYFKDNQEDVQESLFMVTHLNDIHKWTREKIADYIAQFEENSNDTDQPVQSRTEPVAERDLQS